MKLTPELLAQASSALNPNKERQIDLRGYKIPAIENLGVTRDQHDAIDLTDNSIVTLGNLPLLKRLCTLLLANNRISSISPSLHLSVPNLTTLVLTNNNIVELGDLDPLKDLSRLKEFVKRCASSRLGGDPCLVETRLNDLSIVLQERQTAKNLFLTEDKLPTALATTIQTTVSTNATKAVLTSDEPKAAPSTAKAGRLMSKEEADRVKKAIANATSAEEVRKLERSLREGYIPGSDNVGA